MTSELQIRAEVVSVSDTALVINYELVNTTSGDVLVCNRLYRDRTPDGTYVVDPDVVYVALEAGPRPVVKKGVPVRGPDVCVEYPVQPFATLLRPGEALSEQITLALPLEAVDAYHPVRARATVAPTPSHGLSLALGWFARADLDDPLVRTSATNLGPLPSVLASATAQSWARIDLDASVPVIAPVSLGSRICTHCGATNRGDQTSCLRCGTVLPTVAASSIPPQPPQQPPQQPQPVPPAGPSWHPTHHVPADGLATFVVPGGEPSVTLAGGLPLQVVEREGDWAHVVAWTGWSGWVDGRRLLPIAD